MINIDKELEEARSVAWLAYSAARSAACSAVESAAWSAARSAESAARSAAARSTDCKQEELDKQIDMILEVL